METRTCTTCGNTFPLTDEFFYKKVTDEKFWYRRTCKKCYNKPSKKRQEYAQKVKEMKIKLAQEMGLVKPVKKELIICNDCGKETDSLNEKKYCAACEEEERLYYLQTEKELQAFAAQKAEELKPENEWYEGLKGQLFHCNICEQDKEIEEMKVAKKRKYVEKRCKACYNAKHKEYKQNYEANIYVKMLEKRRNKQNAENR